MQGTFEGSRYLDSGQYRTSANSMTNSLFGDALDSGARTATPDHSGSRAYFPGKNRLLGALNGAMDVKDAAGMRRLLAQYRAEYPEEPHSLQGGYELIASCLESPQAALGAARTYYANELASTLRRYVRRHCLKAER